MPKKSPEIGANIAITKPHLDTILTTLSDLDYQLEGPQVQDFTVILGPIENLADLPKGYTSQEEPGKYTLSSNGKEKYFDLTSGPHSWKKYFFPPKAQLMVFQQDADDPTSWTTTSGEGEAPRYALIGVRPCDLAGILIQDKIFLEGERCDPIYQERREKALIMVTNCSEPCGTCFCTSMGTGPKAESGFDLALTELKDHFLIEVGSEKGQKALMDLEWQAASDEMLKEAGEVIKNSIQKIGLQLPDPEKLITELLENLDHPHWDDVASRCLSCGSCTLVCPTCFCWDSVDKTTLPGDTVIRERVWDSCFNPDYSYVAHGNTRPNTRARYRQWLTHKFASWYEQNGTAGCVGCGRCITWCPAEINHLDEIAAIREGEPS
ncbi:MAG: 4Fe-4S dicluster domain-containing protein [Anaerolineales bacterium]